MDELDLTPEQMDRLIQDAEARKPPPSQEDHRFNSTDPDFHVFADGLYTLVGMLRALLDRPVFYGLDQRNLLGFIDVSRDIINYFRDPDRPGRIWTTDYHAELIREVYDIFGVLDTFFAVRDIQRES
jgi:hypothetical protein